MNISFETILFLESSWTPSTISYICIENLIVTSISLFRYNVPITGVADNCLMTCHNFVTNSQEKFHIVCEQIKQKNENDNESTETVFVPCVSPIRATTAYSTSTNSTTFSLQSSSYVDSSIVSSSLESSNHSAPNATAGQRFFVFF